MCIVGFCLQQQNLVANWPGLSSRRCIGRQRISLRASDKWSKNRLEIMMMSMKELAKFVVCYMHFGVGVGRWRKIEIHDLFRWLKATKFSLRKFQKSIFKAFIIMFQTVSIFSSLHKAVPVIGSRFNWMPQRLVAPLEAVAQSWDSWNSGKISLNSRILLNCFWGISRQSRLLILLGEGQGLQLVQQLPTILRSTTLKSYRHDSTIFH